MESRILSRKFVKPSTPTPNHLRNLKISFIDNLAPTSTVPLIFYYSANVNDNVIENVKRLEKLEKSLSETLTLFYPFGGRFIKDDFLVDCNDEGVEYLEARVNGCSLDEIIQGKVEVEQLDCLVPGIGAADSYTTPLVLIQVNIFECGGLAIAVRISHRLADALTMIAFINAWATSNRAGVCKVIPPSFDLAPTIPTRPGIGLVGPVQQRESTLQIVTKRFVFDKNAISALKEKAKELVDDDDNSGVKYSPTRVEVVSAVIWRALINTGRAKQGHLKPSLIVHSLNLRGKTAPPMADNTFGNFYVLAAARLVPVESKMELHHLVELIKDAIRKTNKMYCNAVVDGDEFFWSVFNSFKEVMEELHKPEEIDVRMFASWCRIPFYGVDFGWGKPSWVSGACRRREMVSLQDTKCGEGVEAWVTLKEEDMLRFQQDLDIVAFGSY